MSKRGVAAAALIGLGLGAGIGGCNKNDDLQKASGMPPAAPGSLPPAPPVAPAMPPAAPPSAPPAEAPAPAAAPDPKATISGEIVLAPAMKSAVSPGDVVFLVARRVSDNPTARGSLVAVKKFSADKFPIPFSLSQQDMMFQNGNFEGDLVLSARVDKDADPMTRRKGDVIALLPKVPVGARGVKLSLNQIQKEDESLVGGSTGGGAPMLGGPMGGNPHQLPPGHP
ncbi:MAG TPA: hypothetical protein VMU50_20585 [Polyangia bacterium]|nr:hypothetical protein [Polyangia bacterium]